MTEKKKLVIIITRGLDDERSSVAWSMVIGGINSVLDVTIFLESSGVDWIRILEGKIDDFESSLKSQSSGEVKNGLMCPDNEPKSDVN